MKASLKKKFSNGSEKIILLDDIEVIDSFTIFNYEDELDLEIYFSQVTSNDQIDGRFAITKEDGTEMKIFYKYDFDNLKEKMENGYYDSKEFIKILKKHCPDLLDNNSTDTELEQFIKKVNETKLLHNFRGVYESVREYSIDRATCKIKK